MDNKSMKRCVASVLTVKEMKPEPQCHLSPLGYLEPRVALLWVGPAHLPVVWSWSVVEHFPSQVCNWRNEARPCKNVCSSFVLNPHGHQVILDQHHMLCMQNGIPPAIKKNEVLYVLVYVWALKRARSKKLVTEEPTDCMIPVLGSKEESGLVVAEGAAADC